MEMCKCYAVLTWSDAYFNDVSTSQDQLLHHLTRHNISCLSKMGKKPHQRAFPLLALHTVVQSQTSTDHYSVRGKLFPDIFDKVNKVLRVTVGHVYTDILQLWHRCQDG